MDSPEVKIVIGANYGDEGKGLATDYFSQLADSKDKRCLNVLYNGGPQRGHTVEEKNGLKHIFHHFGSGTFAGAMTYFDEDFMVNPIIFVDEYNVLNNRIDWLPKVLEHVLPIAYIHPLCRVTTPWDAFINQIVEKRRGNKKHGSCGSGIWETQQRYLNWPHSIPWGRLTRKDDIYIREHLISIRDTYAPKKLKEYGVEEIPEEFKGVWYSDELINHYISDLRVMQSKCHVAEFNDLVSFYDVIIFEGGQGLALDEDNLEARPHVTASKTGSAIPVKRVVNWSDDIEICYVTRSYFTRHGAGPFPTEVPWSGEVDDTNIENQFQGKLRYGTFDKFEFFKRVLNDYWKSMIAGVNGSYTYEAPGLRRSVMLTHMDPDSLECNYILSNLMPEFSKVYVSETRYAEDVKVMKGN